MQRPAFTSVALTGAALLLVAAVASAGSTVPAPRVAAIVVDGDIGDWGGVPVHYLENGPRVTGIAHDDRFLYVYFRYSDLELARRVLRMGAIVWVNPEGKHEADFGVRYRGTEEARKALDSMAGSLAAAPPGGPPNGGGGGRLPRSEPAALGALEVIHFGVADDVIPEGAKPDGAAASCLVVDGAFTYEFRIPLAEASEGATNAKAAGKRTVAVGFQMGGLTPAERDAIKESRGHGSFSGGPAPEGGPPGGFGGGGYGGGRPGGFGGGPPGGPGEESERRRGGARASAPVWLDVELVESSAAAAPPQR